LLDALRQGALQIGPNLARRRAVAGKGAVE
jgi:hypothetical protein